MKLRRTAGVIAAAAATAIVASACSAPEVDAPQATPDANETVAAGEDFHRSVTVGWNQPMNSQNNATAHGNATANANILYLTTDGWFHYNENLELEFREDFGTINETDNGDGTMTVELVIAEGVQWSDGTPIDAAELILWWGAQNGNHNTVNLNPATGEWVTTDGNVVDAPAAPNEGPAGEVWFSGANSIDNPETEDVNEAHGMSLVTETPEIIEDGRGIRFTFDAITQDWIFTLGPSPVAAHAIANVALGIEDPAEGKQAVIDAFVNQDRDAMMAISQVWNTGFDFVGGALPSNPLLFLSSGPMIMTDARLESGGYIVLERNENFTWSEARTPNLDEIIVSFNEDPMAQLLALQNGEIDLVAPQSSVDVLATLEGMEGVNFETGIEATWEHIDLVFANGGPFDPATYGGNADAARLVRQAFLLTVPRQQIIDTLIRPLHDEAEVRNSFLHVPGSAFYSTAVANNGSDFFAETNVELAAQKIAEAQELYAFETPIDVRLLFGQGNVRRENQFQMIQASAPELFNVIDRGSPTWGQELSDIGSYDASLFGWQSTNHLLLNSRANYITGGQNNFGQFSNARVDELWAQIAVESDEAAANEMGTETEQILFQEGFGLPIFQFPGVVAYTERTLNVSTIAMSPTIFWNFWEWDVTGEAAAQQ